MKNLISVIVPVYNVEEYLSKCIESIINQTYTNLEIILVDDGATDNCPAICDEYAKKDNRIKVIHQCNGGLSDARNTGLNMCQGEYIYLVDSDDYLELNAIEMLYIGAIRHDADITIGNINKVYPDGQVIPMKQLEEAVITDKKQIYRSASNYVTAWGKLYKKEIFESIRYPKGKLHEDAFVICDILKQATKVVQVEFHGYNYLQREGSIMNSNFTLKHLDSVEARLVRVEFYINEDMYPEAVSNLSASLWIQCLGYKNLELTKEKIITRLKSLDINIKSAYKRIIFKPGKLKYKIAISLYLFNKKLYFAICKKRNRGN